MTTSINLTAKGEAKSLNATIDLSVTLNANGEVSVSATSSLTGNTVKNCKVIKNSGKDCIHFDAKEIKVLFNKAVAAGAYIAVTGYKGEEFAAATNTLLAGAVEAAKAELAAIPANAKIKVWTGATSMGLYGAFSLEGFELSALAIKMLEEAVLAGKFVWESDAEGENRVCNTTVGAVLQTVSVKENKAAVRAAKIEEAKETGKKVVLSSYTLPESETPLKNDGEGDMVTCYEVAMPDGSVKTEYEHNY